MLSCWKFIWSIRTLLAEEAILEYYAEWNTSGPVEGLNNMARDISKRSYRVKNTRTLWNRLCLNGNPASLAFCFTVPDIRAIAGRILKSYLG